MQIPFKAYRYNSTSRHLFAMLVYIKSLTASKTGKYLVGEGISLCNMALRRPLTRVQAFHDSGH